MAPRRADLAALRQRSDETLSAYVGRWRAMAARMRTPIDDEEQISMIVHSTYPGISGYLISHPYANFSQLIRAGEQVEAGIRAGTIPHGLIKPLQSKGTEWKEDLSGTGMKIAVVLLLARQR